MILILHDHDIEEYNNLPIEHIKEVDYGRKYGHGGYQIFVTSHLYDHW